MTYDVFISHASEDKTSFVEPLAKALAQAGVRVWYDKSALEWGDSLRGNIDRGLTDSRYGIVVLSKAFLNRKRWTEHELDALFAREQSGNKVILPIWHGIGREDLAPYSPAFADRLAKNSAIHSIEEMVAELKRLLAASSADREPDKVKGKESDWQEDVDSYAASAVQIGGPGSRLVTKTAWLTSGEHAYLDAERFVLVGFNGGGDLMSIHAKDGYEVEGASSPTGNTLYEEDDSRWRRIMLEEKLQNVLIIYCKKI